MFNTIPNTQGNPIFSSYSVRSADFNENMDDYVKAPNELYIEEQKKKAATTPNKNINKDAIDAIPDMPDFLKEERNEIYKLPEWLDKLNVVSPDEIEEWKKKGGMGIAEAWERNNKWASFAPYINTTKDAADAITVSVLLDRAKKGEELTYEQQEKLVDYLRDVKELQVRGFTFGGGAVNGILATIPYLEEFGIGLAASAEGVGLASLGKTLTSIGAKKAARKAVETALKEAAIKSAAPAAVKTTVPLSAAKKIYKDTLTKTTMNKALVNVGAKEALKETGKALPSALASSAKFGVTKMPHVFMGGIADRQISSGVYVTDAGDAVFTSSEHLATSIMKSLGDVTFEALTETAGWTFSPVASYFAKPVQKMLPKKFFTEFDKLVSSRYGMPAANALKKYGYDGVIEEMGEEVLNRFLCQTFGLNGLDEYNFDGFMNNVFYANDPSQWLQEAISFAAVGGAGHVVAGTSSKVADEWNKKKYNDDVKKLTEYANANEAERLLLNQELRNNHYKNNPMSLEEFYLNQGLIKIEGSQSLAEQKLREYWTSQNVEQGLQDDVLRNMSELEKRNELKKAIENQVADETPETATERIEKDLTKKFIDNKTFSKDEKANTVANLFSQALYKLSATTGTSIEEIMENEMPEIQREAEEAQKENGRYIQTDGRIEEIIDEIGNLPDDFDNAEYIDGLLKEADILGKIREGGLSEEDYGTVESLIKSLDNSGEEKFANELRELVYNQTGKLFQAAYHGTPHDFDKFSTDNIGSGEGAQAHGWGLYFAGDKRVSERYREKLTDVKRTGTYANRYEILNDGIAIDEDRKNQIWDWLGGSSRNLDNPIQKEAFKKDVKASLERTRFNVGYADNLINMVENALDLIEKNPKMSVAAFKKSEEGKIVQDKVIYRLWELAKNAAQRENRKQNINDIKNELNDKLSNLTKEYDRNKGYFDFINGLDIDKLELKEKENYIEGQLFEVDIPEEDEMLHEDKMFSEQPKKVQDALIKLYEENYQDFYQSDSVKLAEIIYTENTAKRNKDNLAYREGRYIYDLLSDILGSDKQASLLLNQYGIKGISYDGHRDGRCYVVFDDSSVEVIQKYYQTQKTDYKEQLEDAKNNFEFKKFVNKVLEDNLSKKENRQLFKIGRTPEKLVQAGVPQNNLTIGASVIRKAQNNKNAGHNLSKETISKVYDALRNPIAVIENNTNNNEKQEKNRIAVILDLKTDNNDYVMAAIEIDKRDGKAIVNDIRSIHSRKNYAPMLDAAYKEGRILKVDADKIKDLPLTNSELISEGVASLIQNLQQNLEDVKYYQSAYHGTPHDFDEFSLNAIGSGEGNQAHGWGLYFAENKEISEDYRRRLTRNSPKVEYNGEIKEYDFDDFTSLLYRLKTKGIKATKDFYREKENEFRDEAATKQNPDWWNNEADNFKNIRENVIDTIDIDKIKVHNGQLFKVEIPEDKDLLNEELELEGQNENIKKRLKETFDDAKALLIREQVDIIQGSYLYDISENKDGDAWRSQENINKHKKQLDKIKNVFTKYMNNTSTAAETRYVKSLDCYKNSEYMIERIKKFGFDMFGGGNRGREIYDELAKALGYKEASLELNKHGIKGIVYEGSADGKCYVVFDDKAIDVVEKYYQEREEEAIQTNMLYDNITPRKLRTMNIKGAFVPAENLIQLFKDADESTIVHEFAHWWLSRLEKYAANNEELALDLAEIRKFVKNDGGAFTREQHEKFAVGFETYIRSGSARSNRLKRIFEDFKNALIQIYDSIKQLVYTENGKEYSFNEADVANLEKLFERLLTTENERIKKTVFDRCDEINDRIKEIKEHQEAEMKELDELWKDNIAINNRKSDKKRKVSEYLELAEAAVRRVPKEVREMKQRYKDATLDILASVSGKSRQWVANPRNWEKLQDIVANAADEITTSGGLRAEWSEFYGDTGVSYDNDEIDGDYKLAQQAFDIMVDGNYNFGNMNEDEIGEYYGKFEYLYGKVLSLKGEEKEVAFEALATLFGDMPSMPDEVVNDLIEKLEKVEIDYEEGQKEDFNRKHYPNIPVVQQLQFYVTNKLSQLRVYDPNVRYKVRISKSHSLYKAIKHATSVNATKIIVRKINEYVISDLETQAKNILHKEIQKQIRVNSKLVKVGTLSKGKFDWKTNTVFAELAEMNKMKQKEAFKEFGAMIELDKAAAGEDREDNDENPIATPEFKTDFQSNLKRKFLEYRSSKIKDLNLAATRSLLEDIMTLKFEGRRAKDAEELEKQLQKDNMKTDLAYRVGLLKGNKAAQNVAKFIMGETGITSEKTLVNWETALNALFGRDVAQRYSLLKLESDAEVYAYKHYADFCQKAIELYGLGNPVNAKEKFVDGFNRFVDFGNVQPLIKLMQEYEEEVYNFRETTFSKETGQYVETGVLLSRAEIITLYAWSLNEELEQRLMTQYGLYQVQYMFNEVLSDEDKDFALLLIDTCESMYDENNEVFIRTMGLSLPKVQNYFPSKTVRVGSEIDMLHENVVRSSNPSFIKQRKTCNRIKMKPEQPLSILLPHINKTARYVILSERLNYLNAIFKDATVRAAIKEVFDGVEIPVAIVGEKLKGKRGKQNRTVGDRLHDTLLNQLGASTFENYVRGLNVGKSWADALATNYITSRIGANFKVMFGQLTSVINYAEKMPVGEWGKGFVENLKKPKETFKFMMDNCDYLKARLAGNSMNEIMQKITDESDRFRTLRNFCSTNTKYGDIFAICFGGKPYIDYLIKNGMSKEEAFEKFVEDTLRAQQSGHNSATSIWQKKMSENFFTRMMFAFNNTSLQYERKFLDAVAARSKGETNNKEFIKAVLLYKVFNPIIFTSFLGNLSLMQLVGSLLRGDDDDTLARFGIDVGSAMVFANMGAYGFAGMGISTTIRFLMTLIDKNEYKPFLKGVPVIADIEEIGKNLILKNEVTFADWVEAMTLLSDDATGVPTSRVANTIGGIGDVAQGNVGAGALRIMGWGNYRANMAANGKPPKKNK